MNNLQYFNDMKGNILISLDQAKKFADKLVLNKVAKDFNVIINTLEREQFEIIVVGEFSNGKSTFLNALLKEEILPSSNVPTTALINKIHYREQPEFKVCYRDKQVRDLTKQEFLEFVSEDKNKMDGREILKNIKKLWSKKEDISHLEIGYPTSFTNKGIVLIDSPGTNDMSEERVQITNNYIPRSDAAIFLLNASQIFKASEKAFLQRILDADIKKVFFVINFKDLIKTEDEFREIENLVKENLPEDFDSPKISFVSALHALNHYKKMNGNEEVKSLGRRARRKQAEILPIEETGILEFEQQLIEFLARESGLEKLRKPVDHGKRLLNFMIEQIQFEKSSLNHNIENIELRVKEIREKLFNVESDIENRQQKMESKMASDIDIITRWYSGELSKISKIANKELKEGISVKDDPSIIKENIELATGRLEKQVSEKLDQKIRKVVNDILRDEDKLLDQQLGQLTNNIFHFSRDTVEWGEGFVRKEERIEKQGDGTFGAAVLGGIALFFTGGTLGWGLLGAGLGGAAYHHITKEDEAKMYKRLELQVKERYSAVSNQTKSLEKELNSLSRKLKIEYKKIANGKIEQERTRTEMLTKNQKLEENEVKQKLAKLDKDLIICNSIIGNLENTLSSYINHVSEAEVGTGEPVRG